eukprot:COSAG02_NODE_36802_length_450_cov_0.877493_1_plen_88_part_10
MAATIYPLVLKIVRRLALPRKANSAATFARKAIDRTALPSGFAQHVSLLPLSHQLCATSAVVPRPELVNSPRNSCCVVPGSRTNLVNS